MRFDKFVSTMGPVIAMALAAGAAKQGRGNFRFEGHEGERLKDLDLDGDAPEVVKLFGPDTVRIVAGEEFAITLEGDEDAQELVRFARDGHKLAVMRGPSEWDSEGTAIVNIMMPAPRKLVIAGSGSIHSTALADEARISIAGSGELETAGIAVDKLEVSIAGSGTYKADGTARRVELSIAGSGNAELDNLRIDRAEVQIAGSGDTCFMSDGKVDAKIMGSGNVTVRGGARCRVKSFGSGSLICERAESVTIDE